MSIELKRNDILVSKSISALSKCSACIPSSSELLPDLIQHAASMIVASVTFDSEQSVVAAAVFVVIRHIILVISLKFFLHLSDFLWTIWVRVLFENSLKDICN